MRVFAISDLHLSINNPKPMNIFGEVWDNYLETINADLNEKLSDDDVLLIAGDISWAMNLENAIPDLEYIGKFKGKKIILRGNHDYWWKAISAIRRVLPPNMYALQNDSIKIGDVIFCGSRGWTTPEGKFQQPEDKTIYDREVIRAKLSLDSMSAVRKDTDTVIALSHYPPFNSRFEDSPFTRLYEQYNVDAVVYGHLHGKESNARLLLEKNGITYHLTSCDIVKNKVVRII